MSYKSYYGMEPKPVVCMPLPDGQTDIWMAKNIQEAAKPEGDEAGCEGGGAWSADEVYMRYNGPVDGAAIEADFDGWCAKGEAQAAEKEAPKPTQEERLATLESAVDLLTVAVLEG